jgi:hypothetical protein
MGAGNVKLGGDVGVVDNLTWDIYGGIKYKFDLDDNKQHSLKLETGFGLLQFPSDVSNPHGILAPVDGSKPPLRFWAHKWWATYEYKYGAQEIPTELKLEASDIVGTQVKDATGALRPATEADIPNIEKDVLKRLTGLGSTVEGLAKSMPNLTKNVLTQTGKAEVASLTLSDYVDHFVSALGGAYGGDPLSASTTSNYITEFNKKFPDLVAEITTVLGLEKNDINDAYVSGGGTEPFGKVGMSAGTTDYDLDTPDKVTAAETKAVDQMDHLVRVLLNMTYTGGISHLDGNIALATKVTGEKAALDKYRYFRLHLGQLDPRTHLGPGDSMFRYWNQTPNAGLPNTASYGMYGMVEAGAALSIIETKETTVAGITTVVKNERPAFAAEARVAVGTNGKPRWVQDNPDATGLKYEGTVLTGNVTLTGMPLELLSLKLLVHGSYDLSGELGREWAGGMYFGATFDLGMAKIIPGFAYGAEGPGDIEHWALGLTAPISAYSGDLGKVTIAPSFDVGRHDLGRLDIGSGNYVCSHGNCNDNWVVNGTGTGFDGMALMPKGNYIDAFVRLYWEGIAGTGLEAVVLAGMIFTSQTTEDWGGLKVSPVLMLNLEYNFGF